MKIDLKLNWIYCALCSPSFFLFDGSGRMAKRLRKKSILIVYSASVTLGWWFIAE